jgi:hypothetical protein
MKRALLVLALSVLGCGGSKAAAPATPAPPPARFHGTDLVAAGGLRWMFTVEPQPFLALPELSLVLQRLELDRRAAAFARGHASLDPRALRELVVADFGGSTLFVGVGAVDPREAESQFAASVLVRGRAVRPFDDADVHFPVTRTWGEGADETPQELVIFGPLGAAVEIGRGAHARAAEAFFRKQLHRAAPALRAAPLDRASRKVVDAPLRIFAPGPFDGVWARGFGGALAGVDALVVGARPAAMQAGSRTALDVTVSLLPLDPAVGDAAAHGLAASYEKLAKSPLGHLAKLDHPVRPPAARVDEDGSVTLTVTVDGADLLSGLHQALEADVPEMMGSVGEPPRAR